MSSERSSDIGQCLKKYGKTELAVSTKSPCRFKTILGVFLTRKGNAVQRSVAKLVKSFGRLDALAESLDDFHYTKAC